jgi:hypothetical protein
MRVNRVASAEGDVALTADGSIQDCNAMSIPTLPGDTTAGEEANVSGRNVTLISNANIGTHDGNAVIGETDIVSRDFNVEASERIDIQAEGSVYLDAVHTVSDRPLHLSVSGRSGNMADAADITTASENTVLFDTLFARDATIDVTGNLGFSRALIGRKALFTDQQHSVIVDNATKSLQDADVQLYAKDLLFYLFFPVQDKTFRTNAYVVHYQDDVIVNGFSSENSITRLIPKLLADADPTGREEDSGFIDRAWIFWRSASATGAVVYDSNRLGIEDEDFIVDDDDGMIEWE